MTNQTNETTMTNTPKHVLPNGYTFLARTAGSYGTWAKATDPISAIQDAFDCSGRKKEAIMVMYGKSDELHVGDFGGFEYKLKNPPTPIGFFKVTKRSIKAMAKGDFKEVSEDHKDCLEWMTTQLDRCQENYERYLRLCKTEEENHE